MENYLHRAMEVYRLSDDQLRDLQELEIRDGYIKTISIQQRYRLPSLKDHYGIPDRETDIKQHAARLASDLHQEKVAPFHDYSTIDVETAHAYDQKIRGCLTDFNFKKANRSAKDSVKDSDKEDLFGSTPKTDVINYAPRADLD